MKEKLLNTARILGFEVYQNSSQKWIMKGYENNKIWLIQEKEVDRWLITLDGIPQMLINTKITISIISQYIKLSNSANNLFPSDLETDTPQTIEK